MAARGQVLNLAARGQVLNLAARGQASLFPGRVDRRQDLHGAGAIGFGQGARGHQTRRTRPAPRGDQGIQLRPRDPENGAIGPRFSFVGNNIVAGFQTLQSFPRNAWFFIEVACPLGGDVTGRYTLTVWTPADGWRTHSNLSNWGQSFTHLNSLGFIVDVGSIGPVYFDDTDLFIGASVPAVTGQILTNAQLILTAAELVPGDTFYAASEAPKDTVIAQSPAPGTETAAGAPVDLTLSLGPDTGAEGEGQPEGEGEGNPEGEDSVEGEAEPEGEGQAEGEDPSEGEGEGEAFPEGEDPNEGETATEGEETLEGETEGEGEVPEPPRIIGPNTIEAGSVLLLRVAFDSDKADLPHQWYLDDLLIPDATGAEIRIEYVEEALHEGIYRVTATHPTKGFLSSLPHVVNVVPENSLPIGGGVAWVTLALVAGGVAGVRLRRRA